MAGLIFGIIFLIAGVIAGIMLSRYSEKHYREDDYGNYVKDSTGNRIKDTIYPLRKFSWISYAAGIVLAFVCIISSVIVSIGIGNTGVVSTFGKLEDYTLSPGLHLKAPWKSVTKIETLVNEIVISTPAYTNDSQTVELAMTIQYRISESDAFNIVEKFGLKGTKEHLEGNLQNNILTVSKNIIAKKKADDLLTNRSGVVTELAQEIDKFKDNYYVIISAVNLTNIDFTDEYEAAVAAKVSQQQKYEKALIEQQQALAAAENEKKIKTTTAEAAAEVAKIQAQADMEVAKISADSSEYQGRKEAAIAMQRLASINGWTVIANEETGMNEIRNANGNPVTAEELKLGTENLIKYYYTQQWDGKLPETYMGDQSISGIILGE